MGAALAWDAFMKALAEASELHQAGAEPTGIANLLQHARELLDIIEGEIADHPGTLPGGALFVLGQLHRRLTFLEQAVLPTRH